MKGTTTCQILHGEVVLLIKICKKPQSNPCWNIDSADWRLRLNLSLRVVGWALAEKIPNIYWWQKNSVQPKIKTIVGRNFVKSK